jgi:hypothetical protein
MQYPYSHKFAISAARLPSDRSGCVSRACAAVFQKPQNHMKTPHLGSTSACGFDKRPDGLKGGAALAA